MNRIELALNWSMCQRGQESVPCGPYRLNLENLKRRAGVYIIWYQGNDGGTSFVVDVGQGIFKDRLGEHKKESEIEELTTGLWKDTGEVLVTFSNVEKKHRDGVERYLADTFELRGGVKRYPLDDPIRVNLPSFLPEYQ